MLGGRRRQSKQRLLPGFRVAGWSGWRGQRRLAMYVAVFPPAVDPPPSRCLPAAGPPVAASPTPARPSPPAHRPKAWAAWAPWLPPKLFARLSGWRGRFCLMWGRRKGGALGANRGSVCYLNEKSITNCVNIEEHPSEQIRSTRQTQPIIDYELHGSIE